MAIQSHGDNQALSLNEGHPSLSIAPSEIRDMKIADNGSLVISLKDGHTITITNFHALATADAKIALADGSVIDTHQLEEILAKDMHNVTIHQPAAGEVVTYELLPGQTYEMAFNLGHGAHVAESNGALIITFGDHGEIILKNFDAAMNGLTPPVLTYDGNKFLSAAEFENSLHTDEQASNHETRHNNTHTDLADAAQKLAGIEPAAGGQGGGGAAGGHNFNSAVDPADLNSPPPVGPIGPTALNYGLPIYPTPLGLPAEGVPPGPHITVNGGPPDAINAPDAIVKEDSSITIPIVATIGAGAPGNDVLTVTVTGIPGPSVGTFSAPIGTYDAAHGTWTVTLPAGHNLSTTFTFTPFPNSDVDFSTMHATASQFDPGTGTTQTAETNFHVTVDAVADVPTIHADNVSGNENTAIAVNISGAVTDLDGSESVTGYTISGVPTGFSFNHGHAGTVAGTWELDPSDLAGLSMSSPTDYYGTVSLGVTVHNAETTLSGNEVDLSDNTNQASTDFLVEWKPVAFPPEVHVNNDIHDAIVKEDGSITIPVTASLDPHDSPNAVLMVMLTGFDPSAGTITAAGGGVYDAAHGTITWTLAPGADLNTSITFTPVADGDFDLGNLHATATAFEPATSTSASSTADAYVTTDAVADVPTVHADNVAGNENTAVAVNISGAVTDTDGSESITGYTITGVPTGFSFNHGHAGTVAGTWELDPSDLTGLTMSSPADYYGSVSLGVTVHNAETTLSGNEVDLSDNTNQASADFSVEWKPVAFPPTVEVNNGVHDALVKEDHSITIPVTATLDPHDSPNAVLTVTITGFNPGAGTVTVADGGVYDAVHGTVTWTLAPGANLDSSITFTPTANGDIDLGDLHATATAFEPATGTSASSDADAYITTDAVADVPDLTASTPGGEAGHIVALNIATAVTDTDGSEVIDHLVVSGLPAGATLTAGTYDSVSNSWTLTPAQLVGLGINLPHGLAGGTYTLHVESVSHELNTSGNEPDLSDNYASNNVDVSLQVTANPSPIVTDAASTVDETNLSPVTSVTSAITANFGIDTPGTFAANGVFSPGGSLLGGNLTSDGYAVTVTQSGNIYTGTANGHTVFTLELGTNGSYTFDLIGTLDHADGTNPNDAIQLNFGVVATDSDGDHGTGTIQITVLDDAPTAHDDVNSFYASLGHTSGNVVTGAGELPGGTDSLSHDITNLVTQVQFGSTIITVPTTGTATIDGTYGQLVISSDGSYTYTLFSGGGSGGSGGTVDTPHVFTGNSFPTSLPESVAITNTGIEGELHSNMTIGANTAVSGVVTFDGAGYTNSLGAFTIAADGTLQAAQLITPSITGAGASFSFGASAGATELGFFLIANGFNVNGGYAGLDFSHGNLHFVFDYGQGDARTANIADDGSKVSLVFTDALGHDHVLSGPIYYTTDRGGSNSLNADGLIHTISGVDSSDPTGQTLKIGFEDLPNGSGNDYDFNDAVFTVQMTDQTAVPPGSDQFVYTLTDGDGDPSQATLSFDLKTPPHIDLHVNNDIHDALVKEDGSIIIPVTAHVANPSSGSEQLVVTVSGFNPAAGTVAAADGGVYDAVHGTITWTLAPGADLNSSITFTPTHNLDVDLGALNVTATATDSVSGTVSATASAFVTTDAVADVPTLTASTPGGEAGHTVALNISTAVTDTDGSEVIDHIHISGLPTGATLTAGTHNADGSYDLTLAQLAGLGINLPHGLAGGTYTLNVQSVSHELNTSGGEPDLTDNYNHADTTVALQVTANPSPVVLDAASTVDESNLSPTVAVSSAVSASFGIDGPGTFSGNGVFTPGGSLLGGSLTSDGHLVSVTQSGGTYTGTANGHTVFTLVISADGQYTFTQFAALDHANPSDPNDAIQLNFGIVATDSDGDTGAGTIHVTVLDDAPQITHVDNLVITNQSGLYSGDAAVTGIADGIDHFVLSALNGSVPDGVTYTVYGAGDTLPSSLTAEGITAPADGGSLLVATLAGGDVFFTLGIDGTGHYTFDLITPNPTVVHDVNLTTVPPGNYPSGLWFDIDGGTWSGSDPGNAEVHIYGSASINPSGQGIGVGNNQFDPTERIVFDFAHEVSSASITTVRASGNASWDMGVEWSAYDHGVLVAHGTAVFNSAGTTFTFTGPTGVNFDSLVLDGLTHAQSSLTTSDNAKFTISDLTYSQTLLPNETDLGFNVQAVDGDGDTSNTATIGVSIDPPDALAGGSHLTGTLADDHIYGGTGNDTLRGEGGNDTLYGGAGADHFIFEATAATNGIDTIKDFKSSEGDVLDLSLLLSASHPTQATIDNFVHATSSGGNTTIAVNASGDGVAAHFVNVAVLEGVSSFDTHTLLTNGNLVT